MYKSYYFLYLLLFAGCLAQGQDKIYYKNNKADDWRVTEINPQYIKALDANDAQISYSTTPANVLFVFNSSGNFLVMSQLYGKNRNAEKDINEFFQEAHNSFHQFDKIITTENEIIICKYKAMSATDIMYSVLNAERKIPKSRVIAIIFKDGKHALFCSPAKAVKVLTSIKDLYTRLALNSEKAGRDSIATAAIKDSAEGTAVAKVPALEPSTLLKLQAKALQNIKDLESYLQIICGEEFDSDEVMKTIDQAIKLFITDARIEVSSANRQNVINYKVRDYLVKLGNLKYDKVLIDWFNIQYTSELRKGPDGFYYGVIEFEQRFVGISGDKKVYEDLTRKRVEIVLKTYERNRGGETTLEWDVFLGDIGVTLTKPA